MQTYFIQYPASRVRFLVITVSMLCCGLVGCRDESPAVTNTAPREAIRFMDIQPALAAMGPTPQGAEASRGVFPPSGGQGSSVPSLGPGGAQVPSQAPAGGSGGSGGAMGGHRARPQAGTQPPSSIAAPAGSSPQTPEEAKDAAAPTKVTKLSKPTRIGFVDRIFGVEEKSAGHGQHAEPPTESVEVAPPPRLKPNYPGLANLAGKMGFTAANSENYSFFVGKGAKGRDVLYAVPKKIDSNSPEKSISSEVRNEFSKGAERVQSNNFIFRGGLGDGNRGQVEPIRIAGTETHFFWFNQGGENVAQNKYDFDYRAAPTEKGMLFTGTQKVSKDDLAKGVTAENPPPVSTTKIESSLLFPK